MIKVTFLGTSGSTPTKQSNLPSVAIEYDGDVILLDCGEGTQRQMMQFNVNISKIKAIFLTHAHGDHIIGIAGLIRTLALNRRSEPLLIFIPKGQEGAIEKLINFDNALIGYKIQIVPMDKKIVYKNEKYQIKQFKLSHTIPTCGIAFEELPKRHFDVKLAQRLGISGDMFSKLSKKGYLKIGKKKVLLNSITTIEQGKRIIYATDTRPCASTQRASIGAELLIHEATYMDANKDMALARMHSTSLEAAHIAKKAKVNMLVLTHISARYHNKVELEEEASRVFRNTKAANDGMQVII